MIDARALLAAFMDALASDPALRERVRALFAPAEAPRFEALYLRVGEYATRASVTKRTSWTWVAAGMPTIGSGRTRRVDVLAADAWLRNRGAGHTDNLIEKCARSDARRAATKRNTT